jgi:autotransporter-associated beta strand protein
LAAATAVQFASSGYVLGGAALGAAAPLAVRVGDATMAGAAMVARIETQLAVPELVKRDLGTLVLTADQGFTGPTRVMEGVLQLGDGGASGSLAGAALIEGGRVQLNNAAGRSHALGDSFLILEAGSRQGLPVGLDVAMPLARTMAAWDLGLDAAVSAGVRLGMGYQGRAGAGMEDHGGRATLAIAF